MLVVYTNKNPTIFNSAAKLVTNASRMCGVYGVLYDDYNASQETYDMWKKDYPSIRIMKVAALRKTVCMDDKIHFSTFMADATHAPMSYLTVGEIEADCADNQLFFVKRRGSTAARGVHVCSYKKLKSGTIDTTSSIIHRDLTHPSLTNGRRYKLRVYVLVAGGHVHVHREAIVVTSVLDYERHAGTTPAEPHKDMHIICFGPGSRIFKFSALEHYDEIFDNICSAVADFSVRFRDKIVEFDSDEFALLGFDFVVDDKNMAFVIEVNHRPNFFHPKEINEQVNIRVMSDTYTVLMNGAPDCTGYVNVFRSGACQADAATHCSSAAAAPCSASPPACA